MITIDVDPHVTIPAPRPKPGDVLILVCDAKGATAWVTMALNTFAEVTAPEHGWSAILEEGLACLYEKYAREGTEPPAGVWALP